MNRPFIEFRCVERETHIPVSEFTSQVVKEKVLQVKHNIIIKDTGNGEMFYENSNAEFEDVPVIKEGDV